MPTLINSEKIEISILIKQYQLLHPHIWYDIN